MEPPYYIGISTEKTLAPATNSIAGNLQELRSSLMEAFDSTVDADRRGIRDLVAGSNSRYGVWTLLLAFAPEESLSRSEFGSLANELVATISRE